MATVFCGVAVTVAQLGNIVTCAEHACHYQLVQWNAFDLQAVEIRPAYVLQQHCGTWHEIWYAAVELVYMIIRIAAHIHKFFHAVLRLCTVIHRRNSVASGSSHLHAVAVGKDSLKRTYTVNAALARCPVGIEKGSQSSGRLYPATATRRLSIATTARCYVTTTAGTYRLDICSTFTYSLVCCGGGRGLPPNIRHARKNTPDKRQQYHHGKESLKISFLRNYHILNKPNKHYFAKLNAKLQINPE